MKITFFFAVRSMFGRCKKKFFSHFDTRVNEILLRDSHHRLLLVDFNAKRVSFLIKIFHRKCRLHEWKWRGEIRRELLPALMVCEKFYTRPKPNIKWGQDFFSLFSRQWTMTGGKMGNRIVKRGKKYKRIKNPTPIRNLKLVEDSHQQQQKKILQCKSGCFNWGTSIRIVRQTIRSRGKEK